jgi:hypothetical protein
VLAESVDAGYYPDVSISARQRASDGKMYLYHLAYLGEEPLIIKDLVKEIKDDLGIAAGDAACCRILPSPSEKRLYLSDIPPVSQNLKITVWNLPPSDSASRAIGRGKISQLKTRRSVR